MMGEEPRRILIIKPSALGDIILALPALSALKRSFPEARIMWLYSMWPTTLTLLRGCFITQLHKFFEYRLSFS